MQSTIRMKILISTLIMEQKKKKAKLINHIKEIQDYGAGEIFLQSIDKDGTLEGFDLNLINFVKDHVKVPFIICSGAGS